MKAPALADGGERPVAGLNGRSEAGSQAAQAPAAAAPESARSSGSRRQLKNWRVRSRLMLLIVIPTATALVLGAVRIATAVQDAVIYQRVLQLATMTSDITVLAQRLEDERDQTVYFIALGKKGGRQAYLSSKSPQIATAKSELGVVTQQQQYADPAIARVQAELKQVGSAYTALTQQEAATAQAQLDSLPYLRSAATASRMPASVVVQDYANIIDSLLALESETTQGAGDATLAQTARVLSLVSQMKEDASEQRAILTNGLLTKTLPTQQMLALSNASEDQAANQRAFDDSASTAQRQMWDNSLAGSYVYQANQQELQAQALASANLTGSLANDPTTPDDWYGSISNEITYQMGGVERKLANQVISRTTTLKNDALLSAAGIGLAVLAVLALALLFTVIVARSMVRPLRRLRAGALEVAGVRLPETVRRMSESDGAADVAEIEPIDVDSSDEIGEVARAFDQVHREALRLASNEAALRGNVNAMFVNLSRRSQSLVERQIRLIDDLEQGEQDPDRLSQMFQLDHLATRMRRNSENLLVLAGHDVTRRWTQSVALVDVLRAAVSEIEQYERVTLNVQPGIAVRGLAVNDVVHLIAELVENATSFSAADTPVNVAGHLLNSGGVLLDITDQGVGMGAEEMAHANWRLDNPPVVDVAVSRRMGLFVVARLAARHGIRVRLRPASLGGLTALVWLPDEVISHESTAGVPGVGMRTSEATGAGTAALPGGSGQDWPPADGDRTDTAQAVSAARTPRFTPLRPELGDTAAFSAITADLEKESTAAAEPSYGAGPASSTYDSTTAGSSYNPRAESSYDAASTASFELPSRLGWRDSSAPASSAPTADAERAPSGSATGPMPVYGAPPVGAETERASRPDEDGARLPSRKETGPAQRGVVVPPPSSSPEEHRLPIFESVESDWFRRGRHGSDRTGQASSPASVGAGASAGGGNGWASAADEGWRAAAAASAPAAGGTTGAGLPKRVPKANLIPGSAGSGSSSAPPTPNRSASMTRDRLASFQRGMREGRAAARDTSGPGSEGDGSRAN